ncbi:N-acetylmuramoyl-L-alanine amidase [Bacillus phage vB_BthS_BMBphi]|nr:N-acetylmuramoyl-L-alanine amidase [Bacillus phage vB_BthS_BMBphi]
MQIKTDYLVTSPSRWEALAPYSMNPTEITFHNTYNDASALNEVKNVYNNSTGTSFHTAVDDKEVQQVIPFNRNAWHAGDGASGRGNRHSIGVEICYSKSGGDRYRLAEKNAIDHISDLMIKFNIPIEKVKTHQERSGKYCPHRMLDEGRVKWFKDQLVSAVNFKKNGGGNVVVKPNTNILQSGGFGYIMATEVMDAMVQSGVTGKLVVLNDGTFYVETDRMQNETLWKLDNIFLARGWWFQYLG